LKRTKILEQLKQCGWDNDTSRAAILTAQNGIGKAASRKAFLDGQKMKSQGETRPQSESEK
jgi:hypothetical protein